MNPEHNMQPDKAPTNKPQAPLMPTWGKAVVVVFALLVMLGYCSPDMRAVYVAAWAACF
ncbi:MAG: hypothetical protein ACK5Q1_11785 [Limnobacter sp.]|jgi:hypothetical protein